MNKDNSSSVDRNEAAYKEILKHAVAEIRLTRTLLARQVNNATNSVY